MKVKCINTDNIKTLELGKIYPVKILTTYNVTLLDEKARSQYSHNRFNIVSIKGRKLPDGIPLKFMMKVINPNKEKSFIFKNKKVDYKISTGSYLIAFREKLDDVHIDDLFKINYLFRNYYKHTLVNLLNLSTNKTITVGYNDIHQNFYNISEDDVMSIQRKNKIERIKLCGATTEEKQR